jgi:hypothetical protein
MRATGFSRAHAYRLLERGDVPFQVFAGSRYIRSNVVAAFLRTRKTPGLGTRRDRSNTNSRVAAGPAIHSYTATCTNPVVAAAP